MQPKSKFNAAVSVKMISPFSYLCSCIPQRPLWRRSDLKCYSVKTLILVLFFGFFFQALKQQWAQPMPNSPWSVVGIIIFRLQTSLSPTAPLIIIIIGDVLIYKQLCHFFHHAVWEKKTPKKKPLDLLMLPDRHSRAADDDGWGFTLAGALIFQMKCFQLALRNKTIFDPHSPILHPY